MTAIVLQAHGWVPAHVIALAAVIGSALVSWQGIRCCRDPRPARLTMLELVEMVRVARTVRRARRRRQAAAQPAEQREGCS